jgi:hypothetical protein
MKKVLYTLCSVLLLTSSSITAQAQFIWAVGTNDNAWPVGNGGGINTTFVQENGSIQMLPGSPTSPEVDRMGDNDYYFAGEYSQTIPSVIAFYGDYVPVGTVAANEESAERAFAADDNDLRYHFNLAPTLQPTDLVTITCDALNLDTGGQADPRYGVEVYFNGVLVQPQIVIRPAQTGRAYTTPQFSLASVNAQFGPGADNIVSLKGINYNSVGGGNWMGVDYIQLNSPGPAIPAPVFPWSVGLNDNAHPVGNGGGTNATFVQENGATNALPGSATSPEVDKQADDDYYFAGNYTTTVTGNGTYVPVGLVATNEEAAERALAGTDNFLRYHFNLPNTLSPGDRVAVSFDALSLDDTGGLTDRRYGVEVYFNNVLVQPEIVIRPAQLGQTFTTPAFTLGSVNAQSGSGFDNIVTLRGINHSTEGGGNWMGIDYVQLDVSTIVVPPPVLPWSVGADDNAWPTGDGGGANTSFVDEDGVLNALPGSPDSGEFDEADNDYYFGGAYTTLVTGNGTYVPAGPVAVNEEAAQRGVTTADSELRYHFNLPGVLPPDYLLSVTVDPLSLEGGAPDARFGFEVYFNGVLIQPQVIVRAADLGTKVTTAQFTLASVNAQVGSGFDNIIKIKGISYNATGGGDFLGFDFISLNAHPQITFPWTVGRDDGAQPAGNGGGPNTTFVQENGSINPLPGRSNNPEVDQQSDNDYYFAGQYATTIPSVVSLYGDYSPLGVVLVNEEGAERAFAAADNDLRYHFNIPSTVQPSDLLAISFDALSLHTDGQRDPRYGVEVYFNGVRVMEQVVIRPAQLNLTVTTPQFTLASVNGQVGTGFDNIVSVKGINYNADGGGNWMGLDYVALNRVELKFLPATISNGSINLNWTGIGVLESAPTITGPWTPVDAALDPPYSEAVVAGENRFYRLVQQ